MLYFKLKIKYETLTEPARKTKHIFLSNKETFTQTKSRVEVTPVRAISAYGSTLIEGSATLVPLSAIQKINTLPRAAF